MRVEELSTYEVLEHRKIEDLNSDSYIVRHKKTGAKVALLSNDDEKAAIIKKKLFIRKIHSITNQKNLKL